MIYISCAMKQDYIISLLEEFKGDFSYKFVEKKGIKLAFEVTTDNLELAMDTAKAAIKATEIGKVLYLQVTSIWANGV